MAQPVHRRERIPALGCAVVRSDEPASSTVWVDETVDLAMLFEPHVNAAVLRRHGHASLTAYAAQIARGAPFSFKATAAFGQLEGLDALDELARELPPDDARDALIEDIAYWIEVVTEMTAAPRVGVRLIRLDAPMCPRFHVDHVTARLVCTYAGAASEWLDERDVDRALVTGPLFVDAAIRRNATILRCDPLDIVLFKGTAWPGNERRGVVHRSPPRSEPRLLLTIDPLG
jgi:hypothetical protein